MELTERQQEIVAYRGGDLLVAASAGSGKTETLAQRVLGLICDTSHPIGVERMLIVTFTRAAAAELRGRISVMLRRAAAQTGDRRLASRLRRQETLLDAAEIGTIDAWCARLARDHYAEAGIDPAFRVLNGEQAGLLRAETLDQLFERIYTSNDDFAKTARTWIRRQARPGDEFLRDALLDLHEFRGQLLDPHAWSRDWAAFYSQDESTLQREHRRAVALELCDEFSFQAEQINQILRNEGEGDLATAMTNYAIELRALRDALETGAEPRELVERLTRCDAFRPPRGSAERDAIKRFDERWRVRRLIDRWSTERLESIERHAALVAGQALTLINLEREFADLLESRKRAMSSYEFHDVLRIALNLLGSPQDAAGPFAPTPLALQLRQRYDAVIVDEFQDTSPLQVELLRLVSRSDASGGNRFFVGDVKQSIYGFRHAAPRLFVEIAQRLQARQPASVKPLSDNFRSHRDLLAPLNEIFARLFDARIGGTSYGDDERLIARRIEPPNPTLDDPARVEIHALDDPERGEDGEGDAREPSLQKIDREARIIAERVRDLLARGAQIPQREENGVTLRPIALSDIVVLLRSAVQNAPRLAAALRKAGLNAAAVGRESVLVSPEVVDLCGVLSLLANRQQDLALAAYLRGPLVELTERELLEIRRATAKGGFFRATRAALRGKVSNALIEKLSRAFEQLDRWVSAARRDDLAAVVRRILNDTQLEAFAAAQPGGAHRVAMLGAFQQMASEYAARVGGGVGSFCSYLEALRAQEVAPDASAPPSSDAVRVMTIHASKGLQYPVVFLALSGADFQRRVRGRSLYLSETLGIGLRRDDYDARCEILNPAALAIDARDFQASLDEEMRLLYVAATRAQDLFIVTGHARPKTLDATLARPSAGALTLMERLTASSTLEWFLSAAWSAGVVADAPGKRGGVAFRRYGQNLESEPSEAPSPHATVVASIAEAGARNDAFGAADTTWVDTALRVLQCEPDLRESRMPASLSVSRAKQLAAPAAKTAWNDVKLQRSAIARAKKADGVRLGSAWHRFLALADMRRIDSESAIRDQIGNLVTKGQMTQAEAEVIVPADIAWFGNSDAGRLLARHAITVLREQPIVWAIPQNTAPNRTNADNTAPATLLRGTIDCLFDTEAGLVIYDYKTDRRRRDWEERVALYQAQIGWYAGAMGEIMGRPIHRAALIFIRERQIVDVRARLDIAQFAQLPT